MEPQGVLYFKYKGVTFKQLTPVKPTFDYIKMVFKPNTGKNGESNDNVYMR